MCWVTLESLLVFYPTRATNSASLPLHTNPAFAQAVIFCFLDSYIALVSGVTPLQAICNLAARVITLLPPYCLKDKSYSPVAHIKTSIISHPPPAYPAIVCGYPFPAHLPDKLYCPPNADLLTCPVTLHVLYCSLLAGMPSANLFIWATPAFKKPFLTPSLSSRALLPYAHPVLQTNLTNTITLLQCNGLPVDYKFFDNKNYMYFHIYIPRT